MSRAFMAAPLLALLACSHGSPTEPSSSAGGGSGVFQGQTVSAVDGAASPNLSVQVGSRRATTDGNGLFEIDLGGAGAFQATIRGSGVVDRGTTVNGGSTDRTRVSMIPSAFDLTAFNEMFRAGHDRLQRWTTRPALVVLATTMNYRNSSDTEFVAASEQMSEDEANLMIAHMTEGLALLTGGTYATFASIDVERPASGTRVTALRSNTIVVGRYNGIVTFSNTIGYGQWSEMSDGTIVGGAMYLDRDFDKNDSRRRLLRIHELGHALGYQHVNARTSIMNPSIGPDPTDFDRAGAIIAFQRPIGNVAPDQDPTSTPRTSSVVGSGARWMPPVFCK